LLFFYSSRRRHTRSKRDWSTDVCSYDHTDLPLLKCFSIRQRFLLRYEYFSSREDIITDLWIESLFVNLFRVYPRFISNIILQRRSEERRVGKQCIFRTLKRATHKH